ncbi:MAG: hypothetical protein DRN96_02360 [Thermoproteota archaeon]|nr:MAG: hypothetical protein DRN96_02360 [Candidatus Korarchaeota archaeon]RLG55901.1 MAG: hypothetical protein DRN99_01300 [Candidatus Korarchaeota archaeon]
MESKRRILVLCVDRDDDLGRKTGIRGPVIGREENLKAANRLILEDPEESDANAIFAAVKTHDELAKRYGEDSVEVATLTGHYRRGLIADDEIRRQIREVLAKFPAEEAVFVSDGADDEHILPLLAGYVKTFSLKRIIVQQSKELETTYVILRRYISEKLLANRAFRAAFIGVPGFLLLLYSMLSLAGLQAYLKLGFIGFMGAVLTIFGFGLQPMLGRLKRDVGGKLGVFTLTIGGALLAISVYTGYLRAEGAPLNIRFIQLVLNVLENTLGYIIFSMIIGLSGVAAGSIIEKRRRRAESNIAAMIMLGLTYPALKAIIEFMRGEKSIYYLSIVLGTVTLAAVASFIALHVILLRIIKGKNGEGD